MTGVSHLSPTNEILWDQVQFGKLCGSKYKCKKMKVCSKEESSSITMRKREKQKEKIKERKGGEENRGQGEQGEV